jgi:RNA pseudouridylate synthase
MSRFGGGLSPPHAIRAMALLTWSLAVGALGSWLFVPVAVAGLQSSRQQVSYRCRCGSGGLYFRQDFSLSVRFLQSKILCCRRPRNTVESQGLFSIPLRADAVVSNNDNIPFAESKAREFQETTTLNEQLEFPNGIPNGFVVVKRYVLPQVFDLSRLTLSESSDDLDSGGCDRIQENFRQLERLNLSLTNITLPTALLLMDPHTYPSISRARKAVRKGSILIARPSSTPTGAVYNIFNDTSISFRGRVGDRVYPNDVLGVQVRMSMTTTSSLTGSTAPRFLGIAHRKPPFDLPVIYEDDHWALVNKPAGVVVYAHKSSGHGILTVRAALPFCLKPPSFGTLAILRRPMAIHRLDKPTSGILCIAKSKPAMTDLGRQFRDRGKNTLCRQPFVTAAFTHKTIFLSHTLGSCQENLHGNIERDSL